MKYKVEISSDNANELADILILADVFMNGGEDDATVSFRQVTSATLWLLQQIDDYVLGKEIEPGENMDKLVASFRDIADKLERRELSS